MLHYEALRLIHRHGDEDLAPMVEQSGGHHDPAAHDVEHGVNWFRRVYRCTTCEDEIVIEGQAEEPKKRA
jgi:hypothetical protein